MTNPLSETDQKEIFRNIVDAQDNGVPVARCREEIASKHGLEPSDIVEIERAGIRAKWPPLDTSS